MFVLLFLLLLPLFAFSPRVRRGWLAFWACLVGGVLLGSAPYPVAGATCRRRWTASPP